MVAVYLVCLVHLTCGRCLPHLPRQSCLCSLFASSASFFVCFCVSAGLLLLCAYVLCLSRLACSCYGRCLPCLPCPSDLWSLFSSSASFSICLCISTSLWLLCACVPCFPRLACGRCCLPRQFFCKWFKH